MSVSCRTRALVALVGIVAGAAQSAACGEVDLAPEGAVCGDDADCSSDFCDWGTCAIPTHPYGHACDPDWELGKTGVCAGYRCQSGRCRSCVSDSDCRVDSCVDCLKGTGKCYYTVSFPGATCGRREMPLPDWVPVESCDEDADCPEDSFCDLNACLRKDVGSVQGSPYGSECTTSETCTDFPCIAGRCRSCATQGDCPAGRECARALPEGMACRVPP